MSDTPNTDDNKQQSDSKSNYKLIPYTGFMIFAGVILILTVLWSIGNPEFYYVATPLSFGFLPVSISTLISLTLKPTVIFGVVMLILTIIAIAFNHTTPDTDTRGLRNLLILIVAVAVIIGVVGYGVSITTAANTAPTPPDVAFNQTTPVIEQNGEYPIQDNHRVITLENGNITTNNTGEIRIETPNRSVVLDESDLPLTKGDTLVKAEHEVIVYWAPQGASEHEEMPIYGSKW